MKYYDDELQALQKQLSRRRCKGGLGGGMSAEQAGEVMNIQENAMKKIQGGVLWHRNELL